MHQLSEVALHDAVWRETCTTHATPTIAIVPAYAPSSPFCRSFIHSRRSMLS